MADPEATQLLLGQKISVIRSIHRSGSKAIEAVEIETKHGRVVNFGGTELTVQAGAATSEILPPGDSGVPARIDLTERLSFAFRSDQLVAQIERLQSEDENQTSVRAWRVCFSSGDYFVIFHRDGVIDIVCNELPRDFRTSSASR